LGPDGTDELKTNLHSRPGQQPLPEQSCVISMQIPDDFFLFFFFFFFLAAPSSPPVSATSAAPRPTERRESNESMKLDHRLPGLSLIVSPCRACRAAAVPVMRSRPETRRPARIFRLRNP
jgi:hypothetical protein